MPLDLVLRQARIIGTAGPLDIGIADGRIVEIAAHVATDAPELPLDNRLAFPGFVDSHIHLDKSCISDRCRSKCGTVQEAIAAVAAAKAAFTEDDIYSRARRSLERAIVQGTTHMRTHVEIDPRIGLRGFDAIRKLKAEYAWAIDLEICAFPQEGLTNDPGTEELLLAACAGGADLIGGCPYTDTDPDGHVARIFALAERFDLDIDLHLDFDIDPTWMHLEEVCRLTDKSRRGGRVAIGHATKLSALAPDAFHAVARRLAGAGVAVTVLPATDLFLMGRSQDHDVRRGVADANLLMEHGVNCSLSSNNILNPATPYGDCSLLRMANLYANVIQLDRAAQLRECFRMLTDRSAALLNFKDYGIAIGHPADVVIIDAQTPEQAVAEIAQPVAVFKNGKRTVRWELPELVRP
jgi:cytosine/creatinine deaminase